MRWIALLALLGFAATASAQTNATNPWSRGTTLDVFVGTATTPKTMETFGAAVGWKLTHRFEIQGVGAWFPQSNVTDEFAADLKLLMNLTRPARIVPYVGGGAGLYQGLLDGTRTETDPTAVIAAGAHLYVRPHWSIRPEVVMRIVIDHSHAYRVTTVAFAVAYHFEEHTAGNAR
jgi:Outer membrane protein beta-barrel domain